MISLEISNSSAISKINFLEEESILGIAYTSNSDKVYEFFCDDFDDVKNKIQSTLQKNESLGKLIHTLRKNGEIQSTEIKS